jgi:hypothetical protein
MPPALTLVLTFMFFPPFAILLVLNSEAIRDAPQGRDAIARIASNRTMTVWASIAHDDSAGLDVRLDLHLRASYPSSGCQGQMQERFAWRQEPRRIPPALTLVLTFMFFLPFGSRV